VTPRLSARNPINLHQLSANVIVAAWSPQYESKTRYFPRFGCKICTGASTHRHKKGDLSGPRDGVNFSAILRLIGTLVDNYLIIHMYVRGDIGMIDSLTVVRHAMIPHIENQPYTSAASTYLGNELRTNGALRFDTIQDQSAPKVVISPLARVQSKIGTSSNVPASCVPRAYRTTFHDPSK
jgi:hypothetical protein